MLLFVSLPNRSRLRVSGIQKVYSCAQWPIGQINTLDPCQSSLRPEGTTLRAGSFFKHHAFPFVFHSHRSSRIRSISGRIPQTRWRTIWRTSTVSRYFKYGNIKGITNACVGINGRIAQLWLPLSNQLPGGR